MKKVEKVMLIGKIPITIIFLILFIISSSKNLYSTELPNPTTNSFDLSSLIELTKQHPDILKLKENLESAKAKAKKIQVLPDPMISFGISKKEGMKENTLMFQQAFPYPGKLTLMGKIENYEVKMIEQELSETILKKFGQIKKDYYELFLINKEIEITNRTKEYLKHIEGIATAMYSTGMIQQTDILRIQQEISMQVEKLIMLDAKKRENYISDNVV